MKFVKIEDVEKILGDIYESMGSSRHNWYDPLRKNDVEEWWWSNDKNNDFVEHGHWISHNDDGVYHECSNCGVHDYWNTSNVYIMFDYCPDCGAKMDGDLNA